MEGQAWPWEFQVGRLHISSIRLGSNRYASHLCASFNKANANQIMDKRKRDSFPKYSKTDQQLKFKTNFPTDVHQTNFPTDVTKPSPVHLLHACALKCRSYGPRVGPWDFQGGGRGIPTGRTGPGPGRGCGPLDQKKFKPKVLWGEISLPTCMLSHLARKHDLKIDRDMKK